MSDKNAQKDVRMRGFASRSTVETALTWIDDHVKPLANEQVNINAAAGRILAKDVISQVNVPSFDRGMMDGYALKAADIQGASAYNPITLSVIGQSLPAQPFDATLEHSQAVRIMTGAPIPDGCDAVLPVEQTEADGDKVNILGEVPPQKNIGRVGEDIASGSIVLKAGRKLRPQDVGVLASIGVGEVTVYRKPRVRIIVTGNELLPAGSPAEPFKIIDSNSPMLSALITRDGAEVKMPGILPDDPDEILAALTDEEVDLILVSGGSSVGQEDYAPALVKEHGDLPIHGIAMRPSSPAGMGMIQNKPVFLLPGNPVSCLCAYDFFASRAIRLQAGNSPEWPYEKFTGTLTRKVSSVVGRRDYARVLITDEGIDPLAISGASLLSSTTRADGFMIIPDDSEGFPAGASVEVYRY